MAIANSLEIIRMIVQSSKEDLPLPHAIIFLFSGSSDSGRVGVSSWIRSHPWWKTVKIVIRFF